MKQLLLIGQDNKKSGFTLIEIIVVTILFSSLALILTQSLFALFRSATKADSIKEVKQVGDTIMSNLETRIRSAASVICLDTSTLEVVTYDNTILTYACTSQTDGDSGLSYGDLLLTPPGVALNGGRIKLASCATSDIQFTCNTVNGVTSVAIDLTLQQGNLLAQDTESAQERFRTTIVLRNR